MRDSAAATCRAPPAPRRTRTSLHMRFLSAWPPQRRGHRQLCHVPPVPLDPSHSVPNRRPSLTARWRTGQNRALKPKVQRRRGERHKPAQDAVRRVESMVPQAFGRTFFRRSAFFMRHCPAVPPCVQRALSKPLTKGILLHPSPRHHNNGHGHRPDTVLPVRPVQRRQGSG